MDGKIRQDRRVVKFSVSVTSLYLVRPPFCTKNALSLMQNHRVNDFLMADMQRPFLVSQLVRGNYNKSPLCT